MRLIHLSFMGSIVVYGGVAWWITQNAAGTPADPGFVKVLGMAFAVAFVGSLAALPLVTRRAQPRAAHLIRLAFYEGGRSSGSS